MRLRQVFEAGSKLWAGAWWLLLPCRQASTHSLPPRLAALGGGPGCTGRRRLPAAEPAARTCAGPALELVHLCGHHLLVGLGQVGLQQW